MGVDEERVVTGSSAARRDQPMLFMLSRKEDEAMSARGVGERRASVFRRMYKG